MGIFDDIYGFGQEALERAQMSPGAAARRRFLQEQAEAEAGMNQEALIPGARRQGANSNRPPAMPNRGERLAEAQRNQQIIAGLDYDIPPRSLPRSFQEVLERARVDRRDENLIDPSRVIQTQQEAQSNGAESIALEVARRLAATAAPATSSPAPTPRPTGFSAPLKDVFVESSANAGEPVTSGGGLATSGGGSAPSAQAATPARVIVPQTRDEQLESYENFGKNIPGTIDIGAQSFKIAGPSDIGRKDTVPIPGTSATGAEGIASEVTRRLGLAPAAAAPAAAPAAAAPAQDGGGFFSNLLKGSIFDSESPLSRQQRVMLGLAALKDAGNALEGRSSNFFGKTQQGFQKARESTADRQFKFLQQARMARESATEIRSGISDFTPQSERERKERNARKYDDFAELLMAQAGLPGQQATAAAAPSVATPAATSAAPAVAGAPTQGAPAASDRDRVIGLTKQVLAGQIPSIRKDRESAQEFIAKNAGSSFLSFEEAAAANERLREYNTTLARTGAEINSSQLEIDKIGEAIELAPTGAGFRTALATVFETDARELAAQLSSIKASIAFGALQKMRELSPTGGALGNVSNQELQLLQNSLLPLDQGAKDEVLIKNLKLVRKYYKDVIRKIYVTNDGGYNQEAIDAFGKAPPWLQNEMNKPRDETEFGVGSNSGSGGAGPLLGVEPVSQ